MTTDKEIPDDERGTYCLDQRWLSDISIIRASLPLVA